jgi:glycosyltransferase involved in cell wall biosynthesis
MMESGRHSDHHASIAVSVVVPTRDRPGSLRRCLAALAIQDCDELEVVVVDDGSRDRAAVEATVSSLAGARLVRSPGRGPASARNLGARAASGSVVVFCDDDCEPVPGWARLLAEAAQEAGTAAGRTVPPPRATAAVRASQAITNHLLADSLDAATGRLGFAPTCNLAATREAIVQLPFNESFPTAAGEDRDWSIRAGAAGLAPRYVRRALVVHRQDLDRRTFLAQQYRYGRGAARFRATAERDEPRRLARPGFYARLLRSGFRAGAGPGALVAVAQLATAAGVAAERRARSASEERLPGEP